MVNSPIRPFIDSGFVLRRATADDKPRILEISSQIWEGEDYVPGVIDRWLTDEAGEVVVALADGVLTGFARHSLLLPGFAWFEGIRTDPARQNRGRARPIRWTRATWPHQASLSHLLTAARRHQPRSSQSRTPATIAWPSSAAPAAV